MKGIDKKRPHPTIPSGRSKRQFTKGKAKTKMYSTKRVIATNTYFKSTLLEGESQYDPKSYDELKKFTGLTFTGELKTWLISAFTPAPRCRNIYSPFLLQLQLVGSAHYFSHIDFDRLLSSCRPQPLLHDALTPFRDRLEAA